MSSKSKKFKNGGLSRRMNNGGSVQASFWEGPLPPPGLLSEYESIQPGLTKVIIEQWQGESKHRRELESAESKQRSKELDIHTTIVNTESFKQKLITVVSLLLAATFTFGGLFFIYSGNTAVGFTSVGFVVFAIVFGRWPMTSKNKKE